MKNFPLRCKHCGALIDAKDGAWQRFLHGASSKIECAHCFKNTTRVDAHAMGLAYGAYARALTDRLLEHVKKLPAVTTDFAGRTMGAAEERLREMSGLALLTRYILHAFHGFFLEQALGHEAELTIAGFGKGIDQPEGGEAAVVVIGAVDDQKGAGGVREWEAMIARVGPARFVVCASAAVGDSVGESPQPFRRERGASPVMSAGSTGEPTAVAPGVPAPVPRAGVSSAV